MPGLQPLEQVIAPETLAGIQRIWHLFVNNEYMHQATTPGTGDQGLGT